MKTQQTKIQPEAFLIPQSYTYIGDNLEKCKGVVLDSTLKEMEEEPKSIDYGDLDIMGLEDACK